jgi:hypothetical protein
VGDERRFEVFADFICSEFPDARTVMDVAGGGGLLTLELIKRGLKSTVIDPRQTNIPHKVRKQLRKEAMAGAKFRSVRRIRESIETIDLLPFDLVVGMHPDAATEWIVRRAVAAQKAFAVVPCCVMPIDGVHRSLDEWLDYLVSLAPGSRIITLPFDGRNRVVVGPV